MVLQVRKSEGLMTNDKFARSCLVEPQKENKSSWKLLHGWKSIHAKKMRKRLKVMHDEKITEL